MPQEKVDAICAKLRNWLLPKIKMHSLFNIYYDCFIGANVEVETTACVQFSILSQFFNCSKRNFNLQRIRWSGTVTDPGLGFGLSCEDSDCTIYCMHCGVVCALHIVYGVFCSVNTKHSVKDKRAKFTCFQVSAANIWVLVITSLFFS